MQVLQLCVTLYVLTHTQDNPLQFHEGSQLEQLMALDVEGACVSVWYVQPVHRVCHHSFREVNGCDGSSNDFYCYPRDTKFVHLISISYYLVARAVWQIWHSMTSCTSAVGMSVMTSYIAISAIRPALLGNVA